MGDKGVLLGNLGPAKPEAVSNFKPRSHAVRKVRSCKPLRTRRLLRTSCVKLQLGAHRFASYSEWYWISATLLHLWGFSTFEGFRDFGLRTFRETLNPEGYGKKVWQQVASVKVDTDSAPPEP